MFVSEAALSPANKASGVESRKTAISAAWVAAADETTCQTLFVVAVHRLAQALRDAPVLGEGGQGPAGGAQVSPAQGEAKTKHLLAQVR